MSNSIISIPERNDLKAWHKIVIAAGVVFITVIVLFVVLRLAYRERYLPGVRLYGVYVGGLTQSGARELLSQETSRYIADSSITVSTNNTTVSPVVIPASEVELTYDLDQDLSAAYQTGRSGQIVEQFITQTKLMLGLVKSPTPSVTYNTTKLYTIVQPLDAKLSEPVANAFYSSNNALLSITPQSVGTRMDWRKFISDYNTQVGNMKRDVVFIKTKSQEPTITATMLETKRTGLAPFVQNPLTLTFEARKWDVPSSELVGWLSYTNEPGPINTNLYANFYNLQIRDLSAIGFDTSRIKGYLSTLTPSINRQARDARLTISGDRATVFQQSQDGRALDIDATAKIIADNLNSSKPQSSLALAVVVTKAEVNDDNIDRLGIRELLSEGVTYFPGSSANRITNVRVGSNRFNGVLLKPGEVFSFGQILGPVGPEQGYKEGRVILEGRQESQYGGGLCQVSSTAFRAALLAGLPILERYNHSFAVSYYTAPYGVPGVDATIYYPDVDFKFKNDTKNHILIQTEMVGTTLKFRFYGTKEKEGVLRGPNFIYGSNDPNQPSKTVFYRDIKSGGQVIKTDTFYTTYRSAADFPPVQ